MKFKILLFLAVSVGLQSCSLLGIHFSVHNPKKPGKIPSFSEEQILLGELNKYRTCYDVNFYDLNLWFQPSEKEIGGEVTISGIALNDFDTLQLDLAAHFKIYSIKNAFSQEELNYTRKERAIFVSHSKKKHEKLSLIVSYSGKPQVAKKAPWNGGVIWEKDKNKKIWAGVACESDGASIWWPTKDHTSDEADSVRLHYTVPKGIVAVGNGVLQHQDLSDSLTDTYHWKISYPINTYNITFYLGDYVKISDEYIGITGKKLEMNHYVLRDKEEIAKKHFTQAKEVIAVFEQKFGEYPWYRDGFKLVHSPYAGMEHQTAIAYGNGFKNDKSPDSDYIILHETAHEWWGNSISAKDLADVWLQEGFATYAEALYSEEKGGYTAYKDEIDFQMMFIKNKYALSGVKDRRWFDSKLNSDVYGKGSWVLASLRAQLENDELFFDIIKTFYDRFKYKIVESADFINVVNEKTEMDYTWFFRQYLNNNFAPTFEAYIDDLGVLYYRWSNTEEEFDQLKVWIKTVNGVSVLIPSKDIQAIQLPFNSATHQWELLFLDKSFYEVKTRKKMLN